MNAIPVTPFLRNLWSFQLMHCLDGGIFHTQCLSSDRYIIYFLVKSDTVV